MKTEGKLEPLPASHDVTLAKAHCPRREPVLVLALVEINGLLTLTCSLPRMSLVFLSEAATAGTGTLKMIIMI